MEILKIVEILVRHSMDSRGFVKDDELSVAMAAAAALLIGQGEKIAELEEQNRWIPVTERLPQEFLSVLIIVPSEHPLPVVKEAYLADGLWVTKMNAYYQAEVTHWMPMPEAQKEV